MVADELQGIQIYQLKLEMLEIEPLIWRRLLVRGSITLAQLHEVIQTTMGWTNSHLHEFVIGEHKEHKELLEWVGGSFDPEHFDLDEVNELLRKIDLRPRW